MYDSADAISEKIDRILSRNQDMVYRLAVNQTRNQADAEKAFQEVFIQYITYIETEPNADAFTDTKAEKTWMLKAVIHCTSSHIKKNTDPDSLVLPEPLTKEESDDLTFYRAVLKLPQKLRLIVHLTYYEDLSITEIANLLGIKESTVSEQLSKAIHLLKKLVKGDHYYV